MERRCRTRGTESCLLVASLLLISACASGGTPEGETDGGLISNTDASIVDAAPSIDAAPVEITLSQSTSMVGAAGSIACIASVGGVPTNNRDNSYYRIFDMAAMGVVGDLLVSKVTLGIESAVSGAGGNQPLNVKLHTLSGSFVNANLTQLVSAPVQVADQTDTLLDVNLSATVPANSLLVVEVEIPDADGGAEHLFFIGSNGAGESSPSYLKSATCGFAEPVPIGTLEVDDGMGGTMNPTMHVILTTTGIY